MAAPTPIDFFNTLDVKTKQAFLGQFTAPLQGQNYNAISFSTLDTAHLTALGAGKYREYFFPASILPDGPNNAPGLLHNMLNPANQQQQIQLQVNVLDTTALTQKVQKLKRHSVTFSTPEMTRRSLVDDIVMLGVKVANDSLNRLVLMGEEHEYSTKINNATCGISFVRQNRNYVLSGPIDYVLVSLDTQVAQQNLTNATNAGQALRVQHLEQARRVTCPIEVKSEQAAIAKSTALFNAGVCQAFAQSMVVGGANAYGQHRPFILTDGNIWIFAVFHDTTTNNNPRWYYTWISWDFDAVKLDLIVKLLVTWSCIPTSQIYTAIVAKQGTNAASFTQEHTF